MQTEECKGYTHFAVRTAGCRLDVLEVAERIKTLVGRDYGLHEIKVALTYWVEKGVIARVGDSIYVWVAGAAGR
jgi:hypothetical protein